MKFCIKKLNGSWYVGYMLPTKITMNWIWQSTYMHARKTRAEYDAMYGDSIYYKDLP